MKKNMNLLVLVLLVALVMSACATTDDTTTGTEAVSTESVTEEETTTAQNEAVTEFTAETLAQYNGQNGNPAYVAYEGKVYDVTDIAAWQDGIHQGRFEAGKDYTDVLNNQAPHSASNLTDNAPIVGDYVD